MSHPVQVEVAGGVGRIELARPQVGNAINLATARGLLDAARVCQRARPRVVVLTGQGSSFCIGGDLREFSSMPADGLANHLNQVTTAMHAAQTMLAALDAPIVAAVHGSVAGAGVGLACAADITLAADDTRFVLAYTGIGYTPDAGATWTLPRLIGTKRAMELLLLNLPLTANAALDLGLVTQVVPAADLHRAVEDVAARLAAGPTRAYGATRRLVNSGWTATWEDQLARESAAIAQAATSAEGAEGVAAFLGKRTAHFTRPSPEPSCEDGSL